MGRVTYSLYYGFSVKVVEELTILQVTVWVLWHLSNQHKSLKFTVKFFLPMF